MTLLGAHGPDSPVAWARGRVTTAEDLVAHVAGFAELLPPAGRERGLGLALLVSRVTACIWVFTFQLKNRLITMPGTFALYAMIMFAGACYTWARMPETQGRDFEEIQSLLEKAD